MSFMSTSRMFGKSSSTICTWTVPIFCMRCRMSRPRRPRLRFRESEESATICSSRRTNWGIISVPSRNPVSQTSAIRPSMMTLVSRTFEMFLAGCSPLKPLGPACPKPQNAPSRSQLATVTVAAGLRIPDGAEYLQELTSKWP